MGKSRRVKSSRKSVISSRQETKSIRVIQNYAKTHSTDSKTVQLLASKFVELGQHQTALDIYTISNAILCI